jgi:hypothetical protein
MAAKMLADGNVRLDWVPAIASVHAPTLTELAATGALPLADKVALNNFAFGAKESDKIDDPALSGNSNSSAPGRSNFEAGGDFFRYQNTIDDKAWTLFTTKGQHGYLVMRVGKASAAAWAAGDEVSVMEVLTDEPQVMTPAANTYAKFHMAFFPQDLVDMRAAVVAGS